MSEPTGPVPQRIGDTERDRAAEYLREHLAVGRLDQGEFDDRLNTALTARTSDELEPLFSDLPAPKPGSELVAPRTATPATPQPPASLVSDRSSERFRFVFAVVAALVWPLTLIAWLGLGIGGWWMMFIPIAVSSMAARVGLRPDHHGRHRDRDRRRLERGE